MSNKVSDNLHKLIKSLTKPEKRYFKVFASRHVIGDKNNYLTLFDAMDRQSEYDEPKLLRKFKNEAFINRFSITKNRLYQSVLKSLDAFHSNSSIEAQLKRQIHCAEIMFNKSLYDQSEKLLSSAHKVAVKYEKVTSLIEIRKWQKKLIEKKHYEDMDKKELREVLEEDKALVDRISTHDQLWFAKSRVFRNLYLKGQVRSDKEQAKFKKIIDQVKLSKYSGELDAESKYLYNHTYSAYYYGVGEHNKSYKYLIKNLELIKEKTHLFSEEPNVYFSVLTNVINVAMKLGKTKDAFKHLEELRSIPKELDSKGGEDLELRIFAISSSTELALYTQTARYEEGLELLPAIEEGLLKFNSKMSSVRKATFFFNIAVLLFGANRPNEALKWINELLNNIEIDKTHDVHCMAQMFNLVVHVQLDNKALLPYTLRSTQRFLMTREKVYRFESIFLDFINELLKTRRKLTDNELYEELISALVEIKNDPFEQPVYEFFNFEVWARSILEERPFAEVQEEWIKIN